MKGRDDDATESHVAQHRGPISSDRRTHRRSTSRSICQDRKRCVRGLWIVHLHNDERNWRHRINHWFRLRFVFYSGFKFLDTTRSSLQHLGSCCRRRRWRWQSPRWRRWSRRTNGGDELLGHSRYKPINQCWYRRGWISTKCWRLRD
jgi:hypothetical protein